MAVQYTIFAEVFDIRVDQPHAHDTFFVDTNVLYWPVYSRSGMGDPPPRRYQTQYYPTYIRRVRVAKGRLLRSGLSFAELAHQIEVNEREIWLRTHAGTTYTAKEFRHNLPGERANIVAEIEAAWNTVKRLAEPMDLLINETASDAALTRLKTQPLDGYDLLIIEGLVKANITQVITDDGDFSTVPDLKLFTANQNVINTAQAQGKLSRR